MKKSPEKSSIIIFDEVFNGVDDKSKIVIKKMIGKYLSDSLILVVDHNADKNHAGGFYDGKLCFYDGKVSLHGPDTLEISCDELAAPVITGSDN